ncbi:DUF805 domain-containing protein [Sessilibacter sp. MAH1]
MTDNVYSAPNSELSADSGELIKPTLAQVLFSPKGRTTRKTYWLVFLGIIIFAILFGFISVVLGLNESLIGVITIILYIPIIWISFVVQVKRWHDRDKSGWWILINLIPVIGGIWAFVENGCLQGTEGVNKYGPPSI